MSNWLKRGLPALLILLSASVSADYPSGLDQIGRAATDDEVAAWDIDVRPDFKGLPAGAGSVEEGEVLWLDKCAVCHGDFGDSNEVFAPIALGNITEEDIERGRVASLNDPAVVRTTLMKVATLSTLWDYINRAMPWNAPKSLETDEVYALVAYILNLGYIVDYDFELSNENIDAVQARMPNRNGMTVDHGLWDIDGTPDVVGDDCTQDCNVETVVVSFIPDYAMNAHGNLADQVRDYGPFPGIQTAPEATLTEVKSSIPESELQKNGCTGCHQTDSALVGPAFSAIQAKYSGQDAVAYLKEKIRNGGAGVWGDMAMPPMAQVNDDDLQVLADWLASEQ